MDLTSCITKKAPLARCSSVVIGLENYSVMLKNSTSADPCDPDDVGVKV